MHQISKGSSINKQQEFVKSVNLPSKQTSVFPLLKNFKFYSKMNLKDSRCIDYLDLFEIFKIRLGQKISMLLQFRRRKHLVISHR